MNCFSVIPIGFCLMMCMSGSAGKVSDEETGCTNEDYAIITAALSDLYGKQKIQSEVLLDRTSIGIPPGLVGTTRLAGKAEAFFTDVPREAKEDFDVRNKSQFPVVAHKIRAPFEILSLSSEEADQLVRRKNGWDAFHRKFSRAFGITVLSVPGINREHSRAVIYIGASCI